jgi:lipid-binding SYLF domain-containing protein
MKVIAFAALAAIGLAALQPASAVAATEQQNLVDESRITLDHLQTDKEFGTAKELIRKARAVLIVPNLVKAGFFLGGEGGDGVMLARSGRGTWAGPAFYTLASASFGFQIGIQQAEVVMIIESDRALRALEQDQFKFGAQAGIAVVTLGSSAQAASSTALDSADIIVWSSASGAYAGVTLEGSIVKPRDSYNEDYYGHPIAVRSILNMSEGHNAGDTGLKSALSSL